jgi:hypothetical protein
MATKQEASVMQDLLDRYARGATERLGPDTFCSITLQGPHGLHQVGSNDPRAAACDQLETQDGRGPCILAMQQLSSVVVPDTTADDRWPQWQAAACAQGFRSAVALPAYVDDDTTIALNMYSEQHDDWTVLRIIGMDQYVQEIADAVRGRTPA